MHLMTWRALSFARHVIGCRLTQDTSIQNALDDVASTIDSARHVIELGCRLTQDTSIQNAFNDVAILVLATS